MIISVYLKSGQSRFVHFVYPYYSLHLVFSESDKAMTVLRWHSSERGGVASDEIVPLKNSKTRANM
jgi:hypothetical protein